MFNANTVARERYGVAARYLRPIGLQSERMFKAAYPFNL
ncbi:uncharacterized protein METZ01_LOCUS358548, partial [marine metagenome]